MSSIGGAAHGPSYGVTVGGSHDDRPISLGRREANEAAKESMKMMQEAWDMLLRRHNEEAKQHGSELKF